MRLLTFKKLVKMSDTDLLKRETIMWKIKIMQYFLGKENHVVYQYNEHRTPVH